MATTTTINNNGEQIRVNNTERGTIYSKNFRTMKEECAALGTVDFRVNQQKHSFFLAGKSYYVGPSLQGKNAAQIKALGRDIQICESSVDQVNWVPCLFLATVGEAGSFDF